MYLINPYAQWPLPAQAMPIEVRVRREADVQGIRAVMQRAYPPPHGPEAVWAESTLLAHLEMFPEGQLVAISGLGELVGSATSLRTSARMAMTGHTWTGITGRGLLSTHDPEGDVLYGVNVVVDPAHQGRGIARKLYDARHDLARRLGCKWIAAGARIPGYHRLADEMSPEDYVGRVVQGTLFDPTLSKQLKMGFRVWRILRDYNPDPETRGHAALILCPVEGHHAL
ncbi:MAG: GNAT family N-acetyltransferase [Holophagaceae bacterium]